MIQMRNDLAALEMRDRAARAAESFTNEFTKMMSVVESSVVRRSSSSKDETL